VRWGTPIIALHTRIYPVNAFYLTLYLWFGERASGGPLPSEEGTPYKVSMTFT